MQSELKRLNNGRIIIPGYLAYSLAQGARDTFKYNKNKRDALPLLDEVMDLKHRVENFTETLDQPIQAQNHFFYVQALLIIFPVYYHIGERKKARQAYERAKAWAADEALVGVNSLSSSLIETSWSGLLPWYAKVWRQVVEIFTRVGEQQIVKWKSGL